MRRRQLTRSPYSWTVHAVSRASASVTACGRAIQAGFDSVWSQRTTDKIDCAACARKILLAATVADMRAHGAHLPVANQDDAER